MHGNKKGGELMSDFVIYDAKKWIQKARVKKGAFTSWCKRNSFGGVTASCIAAGRRSKNATIRRRANLAATFKKMGKRRKRDMTDEELMWLVDTYGSENPMAEDFLDCQLPTDIKIETFDRI